MKNTIIDKMSLENIVDTFEQMCKIPIKEDLILFEAGTYNFTGKPMFYFSLVRQSSKSDEYYQLHVDVLYNPASENESYNESRWSDDSEESIFDYIRKSQVFDYAKNSDYEKVEIFLEET